ncbi:FAD-dependent oxidoreductase [Glycomyces mayteni]|uniref:FAD-dependent oxidoreductase n=1 Tax=Glycomyces mayteni TaxID=543887 RepID=A0ABW2DG30_9ACTN|nr:hypothetical protein GCM10025732_08560 [Glycomyces mayteni]
MFNLTFAYGGAFIHTAAGGDVWWAAQINNPVAPERDADDRLERTRVVYRPEAEPSRILAAVLEVHRPSLFHALEEAQTGHRRRIALAGDAAHPVGTGQGVCMAIEDAIAMADSLSRGESVPETLDSYEQRRRPRIAKLLRHAEDNRGFKQAGPVKRCVQALGMKLFVPLVYEKDTRWLYDYRPVLGNVDAPGPPVAFRDGFWCCARCRACRDRGGGRGSVAG